MELKDLIGKKFRRDKYGLSLWEDIIENVEIRLNYQVDMTKFDFPKTASEFREQIKERRRQESFMGYKLDISVIGKSNKSWYSINEIVIY